MGPRQRIIRERRQYNQWVASQTLEDYALRYTASAARKSAFRVGNTAFGPIAFLACEAIGGAITLSYGFSNAASAILSFCALMFLIGVPICVYAARYGVDIDLLTRGAGFGYIGSTITSLIYASFTFLLFAIEASIMSTALTLLFDVPIAVAHLISALVVIPIALYGISLISRFQMLTQPIWLVLQFLPLAYIAWRNPADVAGWMQFAGERGSGGGHIDWLMFAAAASVLLSLLPQIGEQVDYLRFLPVRKDGNRLSWWIAVIATGPGWVVMGGLKLLAGSFLAWMLIRSGLGPQLADDPTTMYHHAFRSVFSSPTLALVVTGIFVVVCQIKINVTNAYAGSIAWSNFFSRVTHSHPGRVVWLVFNVLLALLLMELGIFAAIESVLGIYANFAAGWIGAITADLVINKPLGLSPKGIEFKRAHLHDINPVGVGALAASVVLSSIAHLGVLGEAARVLSPFIALATAMITAPAIAWWTKGKYYLARKPESRVDEFCTVCENRFETNDMALCPAYGGSICSLCCSLDARCRDQCKEGARLSEQIDRWLKQMLPARVAMLTATRAGRFISLMVIANLVVAMILAFIYTHMAPPGDAAREATSATLWLVYFSFFILSAIAIWVIVLANENRHVAEAESARQTAMLMEEIAAHNRTDAALQRAKEAAESANLAKSRYIIGLSHEIRTPLNSIYGYAQLMERSATEPPPNAVRVIRRSAEHMASLIDGLLDISRIEGGVMKLNRDRLQFSEFLEQLEDMFRLQAASKGIEFHSERAPHLPTVVHTDEKRLRQILINLLSNAVKYTQRGHASLKVRYRNQVAEFEVSDTGMGIAPEDIERVFQPFERGGGAEVRAIPGTGLGLTITKLLTQVMGGEINVRSTPGVGTTFTARLLLSEAMQDSNAELSRRVRGYQGPRRRILVVDDDVNHVQFMLGLLQPLGFEVSAVNSGKEAANAAAHAPDLIMVDLSLPDTTGWEIIRQLREDPALQNVRMLIVSANAHEYAPGSQAALHDGFIMKPVEISMLLSALQEQLHLEWTYTAEQATADPTPQISSDVMPRLGTHLEDLWQLGLIGHVRGIQSRLRDFEAQEPLARPLVQALRAMVEKFDMKNYMATIKSLRERS
jgi:signal transduction histidine kinase/CheY-like chemotaxis protein